MSNRELTDFAAKLRRIDGLYLFNIFMKYINFNRVNSLFNYLATREKETDLRQLEKLWNEFIETGDITIEDSLNENKKTE
jgi:hypothetical protein